MDTRLSAPTVIAIILLASVLVGELIIFTSDHDDYASDIAIGSDHIDVTVDTAGAHTVSVLSMNDSYGLPDRVFVYYDESYASAYNDVQEAVGARALNEESYAKMLVETLRVRDIENVELVDASQMQQIMKDDGEGIVLVCLSGALPDTVYDGTSESAILKWISSGGRFCWIGNIIGKYISHTDGVEAVTNGTSLFFGTECIDDSKTDSFEKYLDNQLTEGLSIINNNVRYSPDVTKLPFGLDYQIFGYTDGNRYSVIVAEHGEGSICIVGGDYSDYQRIDLAQIIASGISPQTDVIEVVNGTANGVKTFSISKGESIYVYYGGDLTVYGSLHEVTA